MTKTIKNIGSKVATLACANCAAKSCKVTCMVDRLITATR